MEWNEYLKHLINKDADFDKIRISLTENAPYVPVPALIIASVKLTEQMQAKKNARSLLVLPERVTSFYLFSVCFFLSRTVSGDNTRSYDVKDFSRGDRLKIGNAVVEFDGMEIRDGKECVWLIVGEGENRGRYSARTELMPVMHRTTTKRKLSSWKNFDRELSKILAQKASNEEVIGFLKNHKTNLKKSVLCLTSLASAKEKIRETKINGEKLTDIMLVAAADGEGNVQNIGPGQLSGIPAIIFASDIYSAVKVLDKNYNIGSILIDFYSINVLRNQMDVFDNLVSRNVPMVVLTDTVNSFELEDFEKREFSIWRWDPNTLTDPILDNDDTTVGLKAKHCAEQEIKCIQIEGAEISTAVRKLLLHRKEIETAPLKVMNAYDKLVPLAFSVLQGTIPFSNADASNAQGTIEACLREIKLEEPYISAELYSDIKDAAETLQKLCVVRTPNHKANAIKNILEGGKYGRVCLVIPERESIIITQQYWDRITYAKGVTITVVHPSDYYAIDGTAFDITVIAGWLRRAIMRKIIFSFITPQYFILLYGYENRWKNYNARKWQQSLVKSDNQKILKDTVPREISVSYEHINSIEEDTTEVPEDDEQEEVETVLRENKYRKYASRSNRGEPQIAIPVNFVGDYIAFYRPTHKLISATPIIFGEGDKIKNILASDLRVGEFIVVRETDKDIIRELADLILKNSGKENFRQLATKWKEALDIELLFTTKEELFEKLREAGCKKSFATFKLWIEDEDMIAPQQYEDLEYLALVTDNDVLKERIKDIYEAAQVVKVAHIQAGRELAERLRKTVSDDLLQYGKIDPFNFWEPIDIEIDGIGSIKVLKVIDVGEQIVVDAADTNRLIGE